MLLAQRLIPYVVSTTYLIIQCNHNKLISYNPFMRLKPSINSKNVSRVPGM